MRTETAWAELPDRYPSYSVCFCRFSQWAKDGTLRHLLETLAPVLQARGEVDLAECFVDGIFVVAKNGGIKWTRPKRGKGAKLMAIVDAAGLPLAVHATSANPHESPLSKLPSMSLSPRD